MSESAESDSGDDFFPFSSPDGTVPGALRMGLTPIAEAAWLPVPSDHSERMAHRREALERHGTHALVKHPTAEPAARELLLLLGLEAGLGTGSERGVDSPLRSIAASVVDDVCLLDAGDTPRLRAGVLTAPSGWRLDQRIGQDLAALHAPVPELQERLGARMAAFFSRMPSDRIFERGNWGFYDSGDYWRAEGAPLGEAFLAQSSEARVRSVWLRCERQTLRRLPDTGWVVFTIRIHRMPLRDLESRPRIARHLRAAIATLDDCEREMRRVDALGPALEHWLRQL